MRNGLLKILRINYINIDYQAGPAWSTAVELLNEGWIMNNESMLSGIVNMKYRLLSQFFLVWKEEGIEVAAVVGAKMAAFDTRWTRLRVNLHWLNKTGFSRSCCALNGPQETLTRAPKENVTSITWILTEKEGKKKERGTWPPFWNQPFVTRFYIFFLSLFSLFFFFFFVSFYQACWENEGEVEDECASVERETQKER